MLLAAAQRAAHGHGPAVGAACAGLSLAIVFYFGVFEVLALGLGAPTWGTLDAVLMAMPAIVYLFALSAALHAVNYYFAARQDHGVAGAAERAVRLALASHNARGDRRRRGGEWRSPPATSSRCKSLACSPPPRSSPSVGVLLLVMPMLLHRFPLRDASIAHRTARATGGRLAAMTQAASAFVVENHAAVLAACVVIVAVLGAGVLRLRASVQILDLLDRNADLVQDYAWLEKNLGNLVPMEVVLTMPPERLRAGDEHAEQDGQQYRLTMLERMGLLRQIERRLEDFPQISRALSAATFAPAATTGLGGANRGGDYAKNKALEFNRDRLLAGDYLRMEREPGTDRATGRELWRLNARVAASTSAAGPADYGLFLEQLRRAVEPVLLSYQQRDFVVRALHEQGKQLAGSRVCVLFRAPPMPRPRPPKCRSAPWPTC